MASAAAQWSPELEAHHRRLRLQLDQVSDGNPHRRGAEQELALAERWIERVRWAEAGGVAVSAISAVYAERQMGSAAVYVETAAAWDRHVLGRHAR